MGTQIKSYRLSTPEIAAISRKVNKFFEEMKKSFVSRDLLITLFMYGLLQRQHILVFGKPGTAKSKVGEVIMNSITGANRFEIQLTRFTTEDAVFGPYNIKRMRAEGVLEHNVDGMLPEANFAFMNEFLDASEPLLRTLLGAFQERRFRKGRQVIEMPLRMAYCDTNTDPFTFLQQYPNSFAVLDRIMFMTNVDYLNTSEEVAEMVRMHQQGDYMKRVTGVDLSLEELNAISEVIVSPPSLIQDPLIISHYAEALMEYVGERTKLIAEAKQGKTGIAEAGIILPHISDRRKVIASEVMETAAILEGRVVVEPHDMLLCRYALGSSQKEFDLWDRIAGAKVKKLEELRSQAGSDLRMIMLRQIAEGIQRISGGLEAGNDLELLVQELQTTRNQLNSVVPESEEEQKMKQDSSTKLNQITEKLSPMYLEKRLAEKGGPDGNGAAKQVATS